LITERVPVDTDLLCLRRREIARLLFAEAAQRLPRVHYGATLIITQDPPIRRATNLQRVRRGRATLDRRGRTAAAGRLLLDFALGYEYRVAQRLECVRAAVESLEFASVPA
jgi:hypothetical protein